MLKTNDSFSQKNLGVMFACFYTRIMARIMALGSEYYKLVLPL